MIFPTFKFVSDLGEIGHFVIIDSRSTILKDGYQDASIPGRSGKK